MGLLQPARPLSEQILHLTPMVSVVLAEDCYLQGHYGFLSVPMDLVPTRSPSLGEVLREAGRGFLHLYFPTRSAWPCHVSLMRLTSASRAMQCWPFRRLQRPTWWVSSRTPTCAPSMPST
ncbi:uncharacterized protein LOC119326876 isoform X2 [Triticum dicoccoides]|nr:uncharacterized protein LOC119326876 isoform X2 [Triticum dicoccoides]